MERNPASGGRRWECSKMQIGEQGWGGAKAKHRKVINNVRQERKNQNVQHLRDIDYFIKHLHCAATD